MIKRIIEIPEEYYPSINDLPGDMQVIAAGLEEYFPGMGIKITIALSRVFPGQWVYVRQMEDTVRKWRDDSIREQYDQGGITTRELARIYILSQSSIEKILSRPSSQEELKKRQMQLFTDKDSLKML